MLSEDFVRSRVVEWLGKHDYVISEVRTLLEHGVDIRARKARSRNYFIIECKGEPKHGPKHRHSTFLNALGQIVQRMRRYGHFRYAIALPETFRAPVINKLPWIAAKRLGLEILFVDSRGKIIRVNWQRLKNAQKNVIR